MVLVKRCKTVNKVPVRHVSSMFRERIQSIFMMWFIPKGSVERLHKWCTSKVLKCKSEEKVAPQNKPIFHSYSYATYHIHSHPAPLHSSLSDDENTPPLSLQLTQARRDWLRWDIQTCDSSVSHVITFRRIAWQHQAGKNALHRKHANISNNNDDENNNGNGEHTSHRLKCQRIPQCYTHWLWWWNWTILVPSHYVWYVPFNDAVATQANISTTNAPTTMMERLPRMECAILSWVGKKQAHDLLLPLRLCHDFHSECYSGHQFRPEYR